MTKYEACHIMLEMKSARLMIGIGLLIVGISSFLTIIVATVLSISFDFFNTIIGIIFALYALFSLGIIGYAVYLMRKRDSSLQPE